MGPNRSSSPHGSEHRSSSPLSKGAPPPALSPPVPPKDRLSLPQTPQRKPVQRQKSPLSTEAFSSPAMNVPGSFPDEPQPIPETPPEGRSSKRLSSMTKILPFKTLRKSYDQTSPSDSSSSSFRPTTPGGDSVNSSPKPSLRKKVSGTFWRRTSSLSMGFTPGENGHATATSPNGTNSAHHAAITEDSRPSTPVFAEDTLPIKKRKSGTFWRRTSSLTLSQTMNAEKQGWGRRKSNDMNLNGNGNGNGTAASMDPAVITEQAEKEDQQEASPVRKISTNGRKAIPTRKPSEREPLPAPKRSYSPPPQIPAFVGGGSGLGMDEDFFKSFG
ncbi:uncharacterized protein KY384_005643 [Bacidia gigantensis]|uniref:uncharacterized protein n=1 Tax=Bacidia gigantensis TaxID=2732470 RepID=UPI001D040189|nr:uncharacterized protein KY384_005643 [Bacidia gigantensis]KAG8530160.1 hypothetical protein KY384_005643 [Bacidia gigantensis]